MATASAFSSPDHEKYELMNSASSNDEIWRTERSRQTNGKSCNKATVVFFMLGLVSGAGILVLLYHFAFQSSALPPLVPKTKNGTILGCSSFSDVKTTFYAYDRKSTNDDNDGYNNNYDGKII